MRFSIYLLRVLLGLAALTVSVAALSQAYAPFDKKKYSQTLDEYRPLAEQGNVRAQLIIGLTYANSPIEGDLQSAEYWLEKAAENGLREAQLVLGDMYRSNTALRDHAKAVRWLGEAAGAGEKAAQYGLGTMYYHGYGTPENYPLALKWFTRAAEQGEVRAQGVLGNMYLQGQGTPQNYEQSVYWFRRAATQGHALALSSLALCFEHGLGVQKHLVAAHVLYNLSLAAGEEDSKKALFRVAGMLSTDDVNLAQRLAVDWRVGEPLPIPAKPPAPAPVAPPAKSRKAQPLT